MSNLPRPQIRGLLGPIPQPLRFTYSPKEGVNAESVQRGTLAAMLGLSNALRSNRVEHEFEETGDGHANIYIRSSNLSPNPDFETPNDSWDMPPQEVDLDIFEHPDALVMESNAPGSIGKIRFELKRYNNWDTEEEESSYAFPESFGDYQSLAYSLFKLAAKGTTHFKKPMHVLRHRQTVSDNYSRDIVADVTGTEKIYTTTQLLSECANFTTPLPDRLIRKIVAINGLKPTTVPSGYAWGWRKLPSGEQTVAGGKIEVSTEYILEVWSTTVYALK